jgi:hypothetical protein
VALLENYFGEWKLVSRYGGIGWLCAYALFLMYAAADRSGFLFLDYVNLVTHEAGHFFFSSFGYTIAILGGTLGELIVPLLCAWGILFGQWGLLIEDQRIGGTMRAIGWMGMIASAGWLGWQT